MTWLGVKSLVDVGCGRGISTSWFILHGLKYVVCVEGSHDAVSTSLLAGLKNVPEGAEYAIVEHDFSRGPWWPEKTVDVVSSFLLSVLCLHAFWGEITTFFSQGMVCRICGACWQKLSNELLYDISQSCIYLSDTLKLGWVESRRGITTFFIIIRRLFGCTFSILLSSFQVHDNDWWRGRMESMGFVYSEHLTMMMKEKAGEDKMRTDLLKEMEEGKEYSIGQHLWTTLQVFINPLVASLPQHAHLFAEHGCFEGKTGFECGKSGTKSESLTALPESYKPLKLSSEMDQAWYDLISDLRLPH